MLKKILDLRIELVISFITWESVAANLMLSITAKSA